MSMTITMYFLAVVSVASMVGIPSIAMGGWVTSIREAVTRRQAEALAAQQAAEAARLQAEALAAQQAAETARLQAEVEAATRRQAEALAAQQAAEAARRQAEALAAQQAAENARLQAEVETARRQAEALAAEKAEYNKRFEALRSSECAPATKVAGWSYVQYRIQDSSLLDWDRRIHLCRGGITESDCIAGPPTTMVDGERYSFRDQRNNQAFSCRWTAGIGFTDISSE